MLKQMHLTPQNITAHLSPTWREKYADLWANNHWSTLIAQLNNYLNQEGDYIELQLPYFNKETTPSMKRIMSYFKSAHNTIIEKEKQIESVWAKVLQNAPFKYLLVILGQRLTPASITDERAIPPSRQTLIESCTETYNGKICVGTRAWEKHVGRSEDNFWGTIKGTPSERERYVQNLVLEMIDHKTWWNVFYHYKHDLVYEIRIKSGHGIRWNKGGTSIIGFLEPFINE